MSRKKKKPAPSLVRSSAAEYLTFVAASGTGGVEAQARTTTRSTNLSAIIAVGYKVNSERAMQFRTWATRVVEEFTIICDCSRLRRDGTGYQALLRDCAERAALGDSRQTAAEVIVDRADWTLGWSTTSSVRST